jgi:hypothetical protein
MSGLMIALFVTAGLGFVDAGAAQLNAPLTTPMSKATYNGAIEKCDALAGHAKDACVSNAKAQFGKS